MSSWPFISDNDLKRILWQFTSQKSEYFLTEIRKQNFSSIHSDAALFYEVLDYVLTTITIEDINTVNSWDINHDYIIQTTKEWITQLLKWKLQVLTGNIDVDFMNSISAEKQESRSVENTSISILPYSHFTQLQPNEKLFVFQEVNQKILSITNAHAIRKQLELTGEGSLVVCKVPGSDEFKTVGVIAETVANHYPQFRFLRFLEWAFYMPGKSGAACCKLRYRQGSYMIPIIDLHAAMEHHIEKDLGAFLGAENKYALTHITRLTEATAQCKHGAIIIMAPTKNIVGESKRLTKNHRGILLDAPIPLIGKTDGMVQNDVLKRVTSIDGAVLADFEGKCYSFGVILDGTVVTPGNPDRGSRLNSTQAYVESKVLNMDGKRICSAPPFVGIVRSEDGMADILFGQARSSQELVSVGGHDKQQRD